MRQYTAQTQSYSWLSSSSLSSSYAQNHLSLLKSAVKMKHSTTAHWVHTIKCTSSAFWEIRDVQGFLPFCSAYPPSVAAYAEQALSIRLWHWGWNQINGDLGQMWIFSLASLPKLDSTAIQNCTRAHFSCIVGKFSLLDQHQQMLTGYENWTVAAAETWTASKVCMFQVRSRPIAAVPHSGLLSFSFWIFSFSF